MVLTGGHNIRFHDATRKIIPKLFQLPLLSGPLADLAVLGLIPTVGGNPFNCKWGSVAYRVFVSPSHKPDNDQTIVGKNTP